AFLEISARPRSTGVWTMFTALMTGPVSHPDDVGPPGAGALVGGVSASLHEQAGDLRLVVRSVVACVLRERPDHADVEDCTSEALRRALESPSQARGPMRPWVLGIARHVALDMLRSRQKQRARTVDLPEDAPSST